MDQAVRQRLVGMAVLMAMAIIALPLMFDLERPAPVRVTETAPPRPELPKVETSPPEAPKPLQADPVPVSDMYAMDGQPEPAPASPVEGESVTAAPAPPPAAQPAAAPKPAPAAAAAKPQPPVPPAPGGKLDASGIPQGWVVQVAAMSDQAKADVMIRQLREKGFTAFSMPGKTSSGRAVRVFIGPKVDKAEAMKVKQSVDKAMGLQTMVVPYSAR